MSRPAHTGPMPLDGAELEITLVAVEARLAALGEALRARDLPAIEANAGELHAALARAVDHFTRAARSGSIPSALRHRLASAGGLVAAQRESLARATAALDRAIEVLMPPEATPLYSAGGVAERGARGGVIQA